MYSISTPKVPPCYKKLGFSLPESLLILSSCHYTCPGWGGVGWLYNDYNTNLSSTCTELERELNLAIFCPPRCVAVRQFFSSPDLPPE